MKNILCIFLFFCLSLSVFSQETNENRGTITIVKKGQLAKVVFDDVNFRLAGIDVYGNVIDSAVVEFEMSVVIKGILVNEKASGPGLSFKMQQTLQAADKTSIIYFDKIKAKDKSGNIVDFPKIRYTFGYSNENNE